MEGTFGERLKALRESKGLSVGDLAVSVRVTEGAIRQMESGQTKSASFVVGLRLAQVLDVSPWLLATGDEKDSQPLPSVSDPALAQWMASIEAKMAALVSRETNVSTATTTIEERLSRVEFTVGYEAKLDPLELPTSIAGRLDRLEQRVFTDALGGTSDLPTPIDIAQRVAALEGQLKLFRSQIIQTLELLASKKLDQEDAHSLLGKLISSLRATV